MRLMLIVLFAMLCAVSVAADENMSSAGSDLAVIEENLPSKGEPAVNHEDTMIFKPAEWHKNKWQNSPAIIEISEAYINLLFNRPEIVFALRRGIRFDWQDTHEYSDGKVVTIYRLKRTAEGKAHIDYSSVLLEDSTQTASGSFEVEPRP